MVHLFRNFKLKYQIALLLFLPVVMLLLYAGEKISDDWSDLHQIQHAQALEALFTATRKAIHELQKERGISVGYVASKGTRFNNELNQQRKQTDRIIQQLSSLIDSHNTIHKLGKYRPDWNQSNKHLSAILILRNKVDSLDDDNLLFKHYTALIERLIQNIVHTVADNTSHSKKRQPLNSFLWLQEYAGQERAFINMAFSRGAISSQLLQQASTASQRQKQLQNEYHSRYSGERNSQEIDALFNNTSYAALNEARQSVLQKILKNELLGRLQEIIGYGGLIHNFKNFLIRNEPQYSKRFWHLLSKGRRLLKQYSQIEGLSDSERSALHTVSLTFEAYAKNLRIVENIYHNLGQNYVGKVHEADRMVTIDDTAALEAINKLQKGFGDINPQVWFNMATQRIDDFSAYQDKLQQQLDKDLRQEEATARNSVILTITIELLVVTATLLIGYIILSRHTQGIYKITRFLTDVQNTGVLSGRVDITGRDELGMMASSLNQLMQERERISDELERHRNHLEEMIANKTCALEWQQALFKGVVDTSLDAIITVDSSGDVIGFNPAAENMFHYSQQEALGKPVHDLIIPEELHEAHQRGFSRALNLGKGKFTGQRYEVKAKRADGGKFPIEIAMGRILIGEEVLFTAYLRDITERLQTQADLEQARDKAEIAHQAQSDFLANMSHELRTPLHAILSYSEMGSVRFEAAPRKKLGKYFSTIQSSGKRLLSLLNDLLDLAKLEAGKMVLEYQETDLFELTQELVEEEQALLEQRRLYVTCDTPTCPTKLHIDPVRIAQVITNLLSNAIKFAPENSEIKLQLSSGSLPATEPDGDPIAGIHVSLCDQGIGIPEDELETIFNKFIQSSNSKNGAGGTGLGLSICKEIIDLHGGRIWAENKSPSPGCHFHFVLPYKPPTDLSGTPQETA